MKNHNSVIRYPAESIVVALLDGDLKGRRGLGQEYDRIDPEVRMEMRATWVQIVRDILAAGAEEQDRLKTDLAFVKAENRRLWTAVEQGREERDHEAERDRPPEGESGGS